MRQSLKLQKVFDEVSSSYNTKGPNYFSYFGKQLISNMDIRPGTRFLDLACGTGACLLPAIASQQEGDFTGIDYSSGMVNVLNEYLQRHDVANARAIQMDAQAMTFADGVFDSVSCGLAITFVEKPRLAIKEIHRVLQDGGTFGFTTWKKRERPSVLIKTFEDMFLNEEEIKHRIQVNRFDLGQTDSIEKVLLDVGFRDIQVTEINKLFYYDSKEAWWEEQHSNALKGLFNRVEAKGEEALKFFKRKVFEAIEEHCEEGRVIFNAKVLMTTCKKGIDR